MAQLLRSPGVPHHPGGRRLSGQPPPSSPSSSAAAISFPSLSPHPTASLSLLRTRSLAADRTLAPTDLAGSGGGGGGGLSSGGSGGGGGGWSSGGGGGGGDGGRSDPPPDLGILGLFLEGWRSRVAADPQFPFKVLMEEVVGVSACVLGDMASRPNFGLNELDFVFSTLVVGSILNFVLMYLLAPTAAVASSSASLPGLFARCPPSHMFEPGAYSLLHRMGTFVYKGSLFACVGFAAGLGGTAISNGLIGLRKRMDPAFETPNKPPPTVLNALTWAAHMGVSSNLRYQTLNGVEFLMARVLPPAGFKASVVGLRCMNNVLGGVSFVALARLTGSQKVEGKAAAEEEEQEEAREKLISADRVAAAESENGVGELPRTESESLTSSSK